MKITLEIDETERPTVPRAITLSLVPMDEDPVDAEPVRTVSLSVDEDGFCTLLDPKAV